MPERLGEAVLELRTDDGPLNQGLDRAEGNARGFSSRLGGIMQTAGIAAGAALVGIGVASVNMARDFETSFAEVSTLLDLPQDAIDGLRSGVLDLSAEMGVGAVEATQSLYQAISAGVPPDNALSFLRTNTQLAVGGVTDLNTAVDLTTTVMNAWGLESSELGDVSDILFTTVRLGKTTVDELGASMFNVAASAAASGVGVDEVGAALAALTATGTPTAQATTRLNAAFLELGKGGTKANQAFTDVAGVGFREFLNGGGTVVEAMELLRQKADEDGIAVGDLFGSMEAGVAVQTLAGEGFEIFASNMEAMGDRAGATQSAFEIMNDTFDRQWAILRSQLGAVMINIGSVVLPLLTSAISGLIPFIQSASDWLRNLTGGLGEAGGAAGGVSSVFREDVLPILRTLGDTVLSVAQAVFPALQEVGQALLSVAEAAWPVVEVLAEHLVLQLQAIVPALAEIIANIVTFVAHLVQWGVESGLVSAAMTGVKTVLEVVLPVIRGLTEIVMDAVRWMTEHEAVLITVATALGILLIALNPIPAAIIAIIIAIGLLREHWDEITAATQGFIDTVYGIPVVGDLIEFMVDRVVTKIQAVIDIFRTVIDTAGEVLSFFQNVFTGDWEAAWQDLQDIATNILTIFRDWLELTFIGDLIAIFETFLPWEWVVDTLTGFKDDLISFFTEDIANWLRDHWIELLIGAFALVTPWAWVALAVYELRDQITDVLDRVVDFITDKLADIRDRFIFAFQFYADLISGRLRDIADIFTFAWTSIVNFVTDRLRDIGDIMTFAWTAITNTVRTVWTEIVNFIGDKARAVFDAVDRWFGDVRGAVLWWVSAAKNEAVDLFENLRSQISSKVSTIYNFVRNKFEDIRDAIVEPFRWAKDKVLGFIQEIIDGIHSIPTPDLSPGFDVPGVPLVQRGAWEIPRNMLAILHAGEMVVPPALAETLRGAMSGRADLRAFADLNLPVPSTAVGEAGLPPVMVEIHYQGDVTDRALVRLRTAARNGVTDGLTQALRRKGALV